VAPLPPVPAAPRTPLSLEPDGIAVLDLAGQHRRPALFSLERLHRIEAHLDELERWIAGDAVVALILRLGSPAGGTTDLEIEEVRRLPDAEAARVWAAEGRRILQRIENLPVTTVAAMAGRCLWGATQVALAATYRVALRAPETRIGLPETRLGVLPGWGGAVRLTRLAGIQAAADLMLHRDTISARRAEAIGLVDDVLAAGTYEARLRHFVQRVAHRPAVRASRRGLVTRMLDDTAPGRRLLLARAARRAGNEEAVPARVAGAVLRSVGDAVAIPLDAAFVREAETFAELLSDGVPRALVHAHALLQSAAAVKAPAAPRPAQAAVVGAGARGAHLARLLAGAGFGVRLKDRRPEAARRAADSVREALEKEPEPNRRSRGGAGVASQRVVGATGFGGFGRVDVVLEAVPENPDLKRAVLREVEDHVRDTCVLLSTSALIPVSELQSALTRPERAAGLHLFHPGRRLAEVVRGERTGEAAVAMACMLARRLGRVPVVVADRPGLVSLRLSVPYLNEALRLVAEGIEPPEVEDAMLRFGMTTGPLRLLREVGEPEFARAGRSLAERLGDRFSPQSTEIPKRRGATRVLRSVRVLARLPRAGPPDEHRAGNDVQGDRIRQRLLLVLINEAARVLEEGVVANPFDLDRAATQALGFPAERGSLLFHADRLGLRAVADLLETLESRHGARFEPAPSLRRLAAAGLGFYGRTPSGPPLAPATMGQPGEAAGQPAAEVLT
jgi:3-hydroxyacyl-CoA dehydrogenase / enoyl-CoA hydratase / 3-hydroxybutyryl-CoA epimerase